VIVCVPAIPRLIHRRTVPSIIQTGLDCFVCNVQEPTSYYNYFYSWWYRFETGFIIVEHDVEILSAAITETQQDILNEMISCDSPWCVSPYNDHHLLGCTKFIPLQMRIDFLTIKELCNGHWKGLDMAISKSLRQNGEIPHIHRRGTFHHATRHSE